MAPAFGPDSCGDLLVAIEFDDSEIRFPCFTTLAYTASSPSLKLRLSASVVINFRRDDEALLAEALISFTWSSAGRGQKEPDH